MVHAGHATLVMTDDADFAGAQFIDRHEQASRDRAKGMTHHRAGCFDDFHITIAHAHRLGQQFDEPRVHACENDHSLIGEPVREELFIFLVLYKLQIMCEDFIDSCHVATS